jgi:hypothetical protein
LKNFSSKRLKSDHMVRDIIRVTDRMLKYIQVHQDSAQKERVSLLLEEVVGLLDKKVWCRCVSIDEFYSLFHAYALESRSISNLLKGSMKVYLMVITLGQDIERRAKEYFGKNEVFNGYVTDRLGSFLVEEEVKRIDREINRKCRDDGLVTTHRYSPGYGDFSIKAQRGFFDLTKDTIPGLTISPGCLLSPEKTVSAIKGVIQPGTECRTPRPLPSMTGEGSPNSR